MISVGESVLTSTAAPRRGDDTRERLLDAVEVLIADHGFQSLTHRLIAQRADVHVALLNYHFGSKEQLVEEALARRAPRLIQLQKDALAALRTHGVWTVEDVLWALWQPFAVLDARSGAPWRHYLCVVARLASHTQGDALYSRHFSPVERECLYALHRTLPGVPEDELGRGLRYCRLLFERELASRCNEPPVDADLQWRRSERLIAFLAGGLRSTEAEPSRATSG